MAELLTNGATKDNLGLNNLQQLLPGNSLLKPSSVICDSAEKAQFFILVQ